MRIHTGKLVDQFIKGYTRDVVVYNGLCTQRQSSPVLKTSERKWFARKPIAAASFLTVPLSQQTLVGSMLLGLRLSVLATPTRAISLSCCVRSSRAVS